MSERKLPREAAQEQAKLHDLPVITAYETKILYSMLKSLNEVNKTDNNILIENYDEDRISIFKGNNVWITIEKQDDQIITNEYDSCVSMTIGVISKLTDNCEEKKEVLSRCISNMAEVCNHNMVEEYVNNYKNNFKSRAR
jgi:predicted nucleic acid-binding Zn finger protein